jgi:hypothetical protein
MKNVLTASPDAISGKPRIVLLACAAITHVASKNRSTPITDH